MGNHAVEELFFAEWPSSNALPRTMVRGLAPLCLRFVSVQRRPDDTARSILPYQRSQGVYCLCAKMGGTVMFAVCPAWLPSSLSSSSSGFVGLRTISRA